MIFTLAFFLRLSEPFFNGLSLQLVIFVISLHIQSIFVGFAQTVQSKKRSRLNNIQSPLVASRWASCFLSHPKSRQFIPNRQETTKKEDTISVITQLLLYSLHLLPSKEGRNASEHFYTYKIRNSQMRISEFFLLLTPLTTYCRAFTTKLSNLSSMGARPHSPSCATRT